MSGAQGWPAFFEEPVMLLAFVLLGRAVEERAKLRASSDMTALLTLLPAHARLLLPDQGTRTLTVPTHHLSPGDRVVVLPGVSLPSAPHGCRQAGSEGWSGFGFRTSCLWTEWWWAGAAAWMSPVSRGSPCQCPRRRGTQ